jgi:ABC-type nitrate/sulfonate/bicarbonate transport system substrate-binding protein
MAHQGVPAKVVAAVNRDTIAIVAHNDFSELYEKDTSASAFHDYEKKYGRKLRIGTAPTGTTVDIFTRLWLNKLGVDPERDVEILRMVAGVTPTAAVTGQIDATVTVEHTITLMPRAFPSKVIAWGQDVRPGMPNHVLLVHQRIMNNYPKFVEKLVELHARATKALREDRDYWARVVSDWVGAELLPLELAQQAVRSPAANLIADPRLIVDGVHTEDKFLVSLGRWPSPATTEQIFDFRFYDAVVREHPELLGS